MITFGLIVLILVVTMFKPFFYLLFQQLIIPVQTPNLKVNALDSMDRATVVVLDTRSREEFEVSHIRGARWVGFDAFKMSKVNSLPQDTTIVLYCSIGYRSSLVGKMLMEAGYQHVHNLQGGIFAWVNRGLPVYRHGRPTQQIHPYSPVWGFWLLRGDKTYGKAQKKAPQ